jgi:hypothetical protein
VPAPLSTSTSRKSIGERRNARISATFTSRDRADRTSKSDTQSIVSTSPVVMEVRRPDVLAAWRCAAQPTSADDTVYIQNARRAAGYGVAEE